MQRNTYVCMGRVYWKAPQLDQCKGEIDSHSTFKVLVNKLTNNFMTADQLLKSGVLRFQLAAKVDS